jgi:DNA-binding MarR family transcriptional regulator
MPRAHPLTADAAKGFWFYHWRAWLGARSLLAEALAPLGLHPRQFWLLALVRQQFSRQRDLAASCGLDPSALVGLLNALEARGWLRRRPDPRDRRAHRIALTPAGAALLQQAEPLARAAEARQMAALSIMERERLVGLLRKLVDASTLDSPCNPPPRPAVVRRRRAAR